MIVLGITGGIGCGKSYVSRILEQLHVAVYDTDREAKRLTLSCPVIRKALIELLGKDVYAGGALNKRLVADYLFANADHAAQINHIIHPPLFDDFKAWVVQQEKAGAEVVAMESAILFESGFDRAADYIVVVEAPIEIRIERVMARDGIPREKVIARIKSQIDENEKILRSDFVICNDGTTPVKAQIEDILDILSLKKR